MLISLIKRKRIQTQKLWLQMGKSHGTNAARGLAPAAIQAATSSLILLSTEQKLDSLLLKILALRSFQMIHVISSARLRIVFFFEKHGLLTCHMRMAFLHASMPLGNIGVASRGAAFTTGNGGSTCAATLLEAVTTRVFSRPSHLGVAGCCSVGACLLC